MTGKTTYDHCREWYSRQNIRIDSLPDHLKQIFYECWVNYAFAGFSGNKPNEYGIRPGKVYMRDQ